LNLLESERDALGRRVELEDLHPDLFAHLQQLRGVVLTAPAHVGDVQEPVDPDATMTPMSPEQALAEEGRQLFQTGVGGCIACHAVEGTGAAGVNGPNLTLLGRRETIAGGWLENTQENLVRWITDPRSVKPGVLMPGVDYPSEEPSYWPATALSPEQVRAIAAYLHSLR